MAKLAHQSVPPAVDDNDALPKGQADSLYPTPGVTLDTSAGAITLQNNGANNNDVVSIVKNPAGAQSGDGINITMGVNATGFGVHVVNTYVTASGTPRNGIHIENATAATVGDPIQWSPGLMFTGSAWDTDGSSSDTWDWLCANVTSDGNTTTSRIDWRVRQNGGGWATKAYLNQAGLLAVTGEILIPAGGNLYFDGGFGHERIWAPSDGTLNLRADNNNTLVLTGTTASIGGTLLIPDGLVGTPSIARASLTTTGIYIDSFGRLSTAAGGVQIVGFNSPNTGWLSNIVPNGNLGASSGSNTNAWAESWANEYFVGHSGGAITAATEGTIQAPDVIAGGAGDVEGANLTIRPGLGTGVGDVGQTIFQTLETATAGDNIQTVASVPALIIDGPAATFGVNVKLNDNINIEVGNGNDGVLWSDGTDVSLRYLADLLFKIDGNDVALTLDQNQNATFGGHTYMLDLKRNYFGSSSDAQEYHSGDHFYVQNTTGDFYFLNATTGTLRIRTGDPLGDALLIDGSQDATFANRVRAVQSINIGSDADFWDGASIYIYDVYGDSVSGNAFGVNSYAVRTHTTGPSADDCIGALLSAGVEATNTQNWTGNLPLVGATIQIGTESGSTGAVEEACAINIPTASFNGATVTTYYGLWITSNNGKATSANYGIYIDPHSGGTTNEAIHVEGSGSLVNFGGPLWVGGASILGTGEGGVTAATGNTLRAPDLTTGGAGNVAGADIAISSGLGTGTGTAGKVDVYTARLAAAGDNLQTRSLLAQFDQDTLRMNGNLYMQAGTLRCNDNQSLVFGSGNDSRMDWSTAQTNDGVVWSLGATSNYVAIVTEGNQDGNYAHTNQSTPTLFVHSAVAAATATDEWLSITHDGTDGVVTTGSGSVSFGTSVRIPDSTDLYYGAGDDVGTRWSQDQTSYGMMTHLSGGFTYLLTTSANKAKNHDHGNHSNPTLILHSATDPDTANDEYFSLEHTGTYAEFDIGAQADDYWFKFAGNTTGGFLVKDSEILVQAVGANSRFTLRIAGGSDELMQVGPNTSDITLASFGCGALTNTLGPYIETDAANEEISLFMDSGVETGRLDLPTVTDDTSLQIYVKTGAGGALQRVDVGANDSGGSGFRYLRVPN